MRIGIDCRAMQDSFIAGIGYYINYLLEYLNKIENQEERKNEYILLFNDFRKSFLDNAPTFNWTNFITKKLRIPNVFLSGISGTPFSNLIPIERLIGKVDIFHATNFLLPYCKYAKSVLTIHDLSILKFKRFHPLPRRIVFSKNRLQYSAHKCNAIITCSSATKKDIIDILKVKPEKIKVIYEAISPEFKRIDNKQLILNILAKYPVPEKYLLYMGTLEPRKNIVRLIEGFKMVDNNVKNEYKLILIGGKGWFYKDIFNIIGKLDLSTNVKYLGYVCRGDLPFLINGATAFLYPSLYEGFGLPALEAMACGIPTVVSNISCFPETVGDAALMINPYSIEDIADGITRILTENKLRETLKQKGQERAKDFSWEKTARETFELYNAVYSEKY